MEQGQKWRQFVIAGIANLSILSIGYSMGWTSPIGPKLKSGEEFILDEKLTTEQVAWIGSLLTVGAMFGPFLGGVAASKMGRKNGVLAGSIPLLIGWILVAAAKNVGMLYAGRLFWGVSAGMLFTLVPMYCGEIASDDCRGALGSFFQIFIVTGILLVYAVGPFFGYWTVSVVGIGSVLVSDLLFYFMPESPSYFLTKDDKTSARKALATIRGKSETGVEAELERLSNYVRMSTSIAAKFSDLWATKGNVKALYISWALLAFQQFSGINAVLFYMEDIFKASHSKLNPAVASIIIGCVMVISSSMTPFVVDRLGRKVLLLTSAIGASIGLGLLGMFFLLAHNNSPIVASIQFLPVLSLILFIVVYNIGLGPLPWLILAELYPINIKALASPLATAFCWILAFLVTKYFQAVVDAVGMHYTFWICAICCVTAVLFTVFLVPETKGKSPEEIEDLLNGRKSFKSTQDGEKLDNSLPCFRQNDLTVV